MPENDALTFTVAVPLSPSDAFAKFTAGLNSWWPPQYSWAGEVLEEIGMEPGVGGMLYERGPHQFTCHWGRVLHWNPPQELRFAWQIAPDRVPEPNPARASRVSVTFVSEDPGATRVTVTHDHFANHGEQGEAYREGLGSEMGWPYMLTQYVEACS
jgi:uncharacterized protein YndB with AHSA1/START domain